LAQYRLLFPILHLRSQKGLSRSRNEALAFAQGEIICFPDDDCWYPPNLLIEVDRRMRENPLIAGFTGRCTDEHGRLSAGGESRRPGLLNRHNVWRGGVSATMFLRSNVLKQVGGLMKNSVWEREPRSNPVRKPICFARNQGRIPDPVFAFSRYLSSLPPRYSSAAVTRARLYGAGMGRVLRKHGERPLWSYYYIMFPLGGALMALLLGNWGLARIRVARAFGRLHGWRVRLDHTIGPPCVHANRL